MKSRRLLAILVPFLFAFTVYGGLLTIAAAQTDPNSADSERLEFISEITGYLAADSPLSPDCFFDSRYDAYLCEESVNAELRVSDPAARENALQQLTAGGVLLIPDSTNKRLMTFDPTTGDLIDPNFILLEDEPTGTVVHAIMASNNDSILVSDQTRDVVHEYDLEGTYLGIFAPSGGADPNIIDNIRGMALRPNGNLLVTVGAGPNADAIAEFDTEGEFLGNFIANGSGGLDSPFDIYERPGVDWLAGGVDSDAIHRYDLDNGNPLGNLALMDTFPEQIYQAASTNVLVANFSGTQTGIVELTADGDLVGIYNPVEIGNYRGVYELANGNLLTTTGEGVFEIDRDGTLVDIKISGVGGRYIEYVVLPQQYEIQLSKTVGVNPSICADTDEISVPEGTPVTYCFEVTNTGTGTLALHDLEDSELGVILDGFSFNLMPGASVFLTQTAVITVETTNTATWTAYNPGPSDEVSASDSATVYILQPEIELIKTVGLDPSVCADTDEISVEAGTAVVYCYSITNTGEVTLGLHDLEDSHLGVILDGFAFNLMPDASVFLTQTAVITMETTNTATWTAYNPGPINEVNATDSATVHILQPAIELVKTVGLDPSVCADTDEIIVPLGTQVYYCYTLTNTGEVTLGLHDLEDSHLGVILDGFTYDLMPMASVFLTQTAVIEADTTNTATWTAYNPGPEDEVTASASATVNVISPSITLAVTAGIDPGVCAESDTLTVPLGTEVFFCYTVTNDGNVAFDSHLLTDSLLGEIDSFNFDLQPGETHSVIYSHTINAEHLAEVTWEAESDNYNASASAFISVFIQDYSLYLPLVNR
jgi:archaellum component FlaG (FlaF/FlaG flagellin family)